MPILHDFTYPRLERELSIDIGIPKKLYSLKDLGVA
jgi:hypothetical protein